MEKSQYFIVFVIFFAFGSFMHALENYAIAVNHMYSRALFPAHREMSVSSLDISVETVCRMLREGRNITLVDIRDKNEFSKVHIPDSIHVPLYAVKTKPFLKFGTLILVNNGYERKFLDRECILLRQKGFNAEILAGGLNAWHQKGLKLLGDPFALKRLNIISARTFSQEKDYGNQIILVISKTRNPDEETILPGAEHLVIPVHKSHTLDDRKKEILQMLHLSEKPKCSVRRRPKLFWRIIVFTEDGEGYKQLEKVFESWGLMNVFFVDGGLKAYKEYLHALALSRKPKNERIRKIKECKECEKANVVKLR